MRVQIVLTLTSNPHSANPPLPPEVVIERGGANAPAKIMFMFPVVTSPSQLSVNQHGSQQGVDFDRRCGLLIAMVRQVLQTGPEVELADHLGYEVHEPRRSPRECVASMARREK